MDEIVFEPSDVNLLAALGIVESVKLLSLIHISVVSVLLVVLIAVVCGDVRYAPSFLIGFIPQRIYIGGYHATSHTLSLIHIYRWRPDGNRPQGLPRRSWSPDPAAGR